MIKTLTKLYNHISSPLSIVPDQTRPEYTNRSLVRLGIYYLVGGIVMNRLREDCVLGCSTILDVFLEIIVLFCMLGFISVALELLGNNRRRLARKKQQQDLKNLKK